MMQHVPADWGSKVMHAAFKSPDLEFMASDSFGSGRSGNGKVSLSLSVRDASAGEALFSKLAEGGRIAMPFQETFWSPGFGMLVDRYGIDWMVNCG
jgi:PhnB protein